MMFQCFSMFQKQCNMDKRFIYHEVIKGCPKFQFKKMFVVKHQQIIATISQVSMFRMFLFIIGVSIKHPQKVFSSSAWLRVFKHIGRQDYTNSFLAACHMLELRDA